MLIFFITVIVIIKIFFFSIGSIVSPRIQNWILLKKQTNKKNNRFIKFFSNPIPKRYVCLTHKKTG